MNDTHDIYSILFKEYPDILTVEQMSGLLDISTKTAYKLLSDGEIPCLKVGRQYKIPKVNVLVYLKILPDALPDSNLKN